MGPKYILNVENSPFRSDFNENPDKGKKNQVSISKTLLQERYG